MQTFHKHLILLKKPLLKFKFSCHSLLLSRKPRDSLQRQVWFSRQSGSTVVRQEPELWELCSIPSSHHKPAVMGSKGSLSDGTRGKLHQTFICPKKVSKSECSERACKTWHTLQGVDKEEGSFIRKKNNWHGIFHLTAIFPYFLDKPKPRER